jgi:hypothetical protein
MRIERESVSYRTRRVIAPLPARRARYHARPCAHLSPHPRLDGQFLGKRPESALIISRLILDCVKRRAIRILGVEPRRAEFHHRLELSRRTTLWKPSTPPMIRLGAGSSSAAALRSQIPDAQRMARGRTESRLALVAGGRAVREHWRSNVPRCHRVAPHTHASRSGALRDPLPGRADAHALQLWRTSHLVQVSGLRTNARGPVRLSRRGNFACRICQRLAYASEAESPIDRGWRQQRLTEDGERSKGMRRRTFERLCQKWVAIEERKDDLFLPGLFRLAERLGMSPDEFFD